MVSVIIEPRLPVAMAGSGLTRVLLTRSAASRRHTRVSGRASRRRHTDHCDVAQREKPRVPHDTFRVALRKSGPGRVAFSPGVANGPEGRLAALVRRTRPRAAAGTTG